MSYSYVVYETFMSYHILNGLEFYNYIICYVFQCKTNGECMFEAVLKQLPHPKRFTANDFRKMVSWYIAKWWTELHTHYFNGSNESFKSYIENIYNGRIYGDNICLAAIAKMYKLKISVISPSGKFQDFFHDEKYDVLLVHNGFQGVESHFSATCKYKNDIYLYVVFYVVICHRLCRDMSSFMSYFMS